MITGDLMDQLDENGLTELINQSGGNISITMPTDKLAQQQTSLDILAAIKDLNKQREGKNIELLVSPGSNVVISQGGGSQV